MLPFDHVIVSITMDHRTRSLLDTVISESRPAWDSVFRKLTSSKHFRQAWRQLHEPHSQPYAILKLRLSHLHCALRVKLTRKERSLARYSRIAGTAAVTEYSIALGVPHHDIQLWLSCVRKYGYSLTRHRGMRGWFEIGSWPGAIACWVNKYTSYLSGVHRSVLANAMYNRLDIIAYGCNAAGKNVRLQIRFEPVEYWDDYDDEYYYDEDSSRR
jgi:hypothetical protein